MASTQSGTQPEQSHVATIPKTSTSNAQTASQPNSFMTPSSKESLPIPTGTQRIGNVLGDEAHIEPALEKSSVSNVAEPNDYLGSNVDGNQIYTATTEETQEFTDVAISDEGDLMQIGLEGAEDQSYPGMEVDSDPQNDSDFDSGLGSMLQSSTVSLRESIYKYIEENGRTYHAFNAGKYIGPNDEIEQARLDLQHHLFVMTMGNKLNLAPIRNPQNVLDIATGTGIWAIEFAQQHPATRVLGTDLSPIQPLFLPPNCSFEIDDAEEDWVYSQPFDYIHGRALVSCFKEPPAVIANIFSNLTPGGYFELQDPIMPLKSIDGTLTGTSLDEFQTTCMAAAAKLGRPWTNGKNYGQWMSDVGFEDIVEKTYYWATNPWVKGSNQKVQALWLQENLQAGLPAWGLSTLSRGLGWSKERIDELIAKARNDLRDRNIHAYAECYVVYGRKPIE